MSLAFRHLCVTSSKPTGMPCTVPLKNFVVRVVEENVYVEF